MTIFGIIEGPNETVVVNPLQLRMVIPQVEHGTPVCYLMWGHNDYVKVKGTLDTVLGKLGIQSVRLTPAAQEIRSHLPEAQENTRFLRRDPLDQLCIDQRSLPLSRPTAGSRGVVTCCIERSLKLNRAGRRGRSAQMSTAMPQSPPASEPIRALTHPPAHELESFYRPIHGVARFRLGSGDVSPAGQSD